MKGNHETMDFNIPRHGWVFENTDLANNAPLAWEPGSAWFPACESLKKKLASTR
jgi:hypothetical protein